VTLARATALINWFPVAAIAAPIICLQGAVLASMLEYEFFLWDYFSAIELYPGVGADNILAVFKGWWHDLVTPQWLFRPTYSLFVGVEYWLFGSHFWAYYLLKWAIYVVTCYLAYRIVRIWGGEQTSAAAGALLFGTTACHPVLMPFSADLLATALPAAAAWHLLRPARDYSTLSPANYAIALGLAFLASGVKEISPVLMGAVVAASVIAYGWRAYRGGGALKRAWSFVPPAAIVLWGALSVLLAARERGGPRQVPGHEAMEEFGRYLHAGYGFPSHLTGMGLVVLAFVIGSAAFLVLKSYQAGSIRPPLAPLLGTLLLAIALSGAMTVMAGEFGARYAVPIVFVAALSIALAGAVWRWGAYFSLLVAGLSFLANAGDIARQTEAYEVHSDRLTRALEIAFDKAGDDGVVGVGFTHSEWNGSLLSETFREHKARWGFQADVALAAEDNRAFDAVISNDPALELGEDWVYHHVSGRRPTLIRTVARRLSKFDERVLGAASITIDLGAPFLVDETNLQRGWDVFVAIPAEADGSSGAKTNLRFDCGSLRDEAAALVACTDQRMSFAAPSVIAFPVEVGEGITALTIAVDLTSNAAAQLFLGVRRPAGADVASLPWNVPSGESRLVATIPYGAASPGSYELFLYFPASSNLRVTISNLSARAVVERTVIEE
jgi:hypothetical protein